VRRVLGGRGGRAGVDPFSATGPHEGLSYALEEGRELAALAEEKGSAFFRTSGTIIAGLVMAHTGEMENAVQNIKGALSALRSIGTTGFLPVYLSYLAWCSAELDRFEDARSCIEDALTAADRSKERWWQADTNRIAGETVLRSPESDEEKAQAYFEKALSIAREQQTKSWELRAAMSKARLWRDRAGAKRRAICLHRSMAGSLRDSTRAT
jgi:predicted ATPase